MGMCPAVGQALIIFFCFEVCKRQTHVQLFLSKAGTSG